MFRSGCRYHVDVFVIVIVGVVQIHIHTGIHLYRTRIVRCRNVCRCRGVIYVHVDVGVYYVGSILSELQQLQ